MGSAQSKWAEYSSVGNPYACKFLLGPVFQKVYQDSGTPCDSRNRRAES